MDTVIPEETDTLAALDHASGDALAVTMGAGAIIDIMTGGSFDWRSRLEESDFLESADWLTALEYARAAQNTRTDPLHTAALAAGYATVAEWVGAMVGALEGVLAWDKRRGLIVPYAVRDPVHNALNNPFRAALTKVQADV